MKPIWLILIMVNLIFTAPAWAGSVILKTKTACWVTGTGIRVRLTAANAGDQAAHLLTVLARFGQAAQAKSTWPYLGPGDSATADLDLKERPAKPGLYPVFIRVSFYDHKGAPVSGVAYGLFAVGAWRKSNLDIKEQEIKLEDKAGLKLEVRNDDKLPHQVRISLFCPQEIAAPQGESSLSLGAGQSGTASFDLVNASAQAGVTYPVLASVEYEAEGGHFVSTAWVRVQAAAGEPFFKKHRGWILVAAAVLIFLALLAQFPSLGRYFPGRKNRSKG
ncbi:MAG: hypothetical protein V1742_08205 [Pseudomonadota bacterium]